MPIIKSAIKKMKQDRVKKKRNDSKKKKNHELFKQITVSIKKGDKEGTEKLLSEYISSVDKLAKKNIIHKNKAARKKSQITLKARAIKTKLKSS